MDFPKLDRPFVRSNRTKLPVHMKDRVMDTEERGDSPRD